jgi:hypothetical protein
MDVWGDHAVQCRVGRGVDNTYRHNVVRDCLFRMGNELQVLVGREPQLPVQVWGMEARWPDLVFYGWEHGRDLGAWPVTFIMM